MKSMKNFKYMPANIGLICECTDASRKASLSKQLKFERIFFSILYKVIAKWSCSQSRNESFKCWKYCHKKLSVPMALGDKC